MSQTDLPSPEEIQQLLRWREPLSRPLGNDGVERFIGDLHRLHFMIDFDWPEWAARGQQIQSDPVRLATANLSTLCKLLTMDVRAERFHEGHIASCLKRGVFASILDRLQEIA